MPYDKISIEVYLVEINGAVAPEPTFVQTELNGIYAGAIVDWKVSKLKNVQVTLDNYTDGIFDNVHASMGYTDHEKQVRDYFESTKDYKNNVCYLFFIPGNTKKDIGGYMPYNRQYGFMYTQHLDAGNTIRTMAHELGHGKFSLGHPFENAEDARMQTYDDLMSYSQSSRLYKLQWDNIRKFHLGVNWFKDGSEGESATGKNLLFFTLMRNNSNLSISKKGENNKCDISNSAIPLNAFLDSINTPAINNYYSFSKVDSSCRQQTFDNLHKADIYINDVLSNKGIRMDKFNVKKYIPQFSRGSNPFKVVLQEKSTVNKATTWTAIDTMNISFLIKTPKYYLSLIDSASNRNFSYDATNFSLPKGKITTLSIYDRESITDSMFVSGLTWKITQGDSTRTVNNSDTIKITASNNNSIKIKAWCNYKSGVDTLNIILSAPEEIPVVTTPVSFKLSSVRDTNILAETRNNKNLIAMGYNHSAMNVVFERTGSDDFTKLRPISNNTSKLNIQMLERTKKYIKVHIESQNFSPNLDSSYVNLSDTSGNIRGKQVVYIFKPLHLTPHVWYAPSAGNPTNDAGANKYLSYFCGYIETINPQPIITEPDKNKNGQIDHVYGDSMKNEYAFFDSIANNNNYKKKKILGIYFIPKGIVQSWKINKLDTVKFARKFARLTDNTDLTEANKDASGTVTWATLDSTMNNLDDGFTITPNDTGVFFSSKINKKSRYICPSTKYTRGLRLQDNYTILVGVQTDNTLLVAVHELMHTRGLLDINQEGNLMHYIIEANSSTSAPQEPYLTNDMVKECNTGTGLPSASPILQKQLTGVKR